MNVSTSCISQEQMTDEFEDDTLRKSSPEIKENVLTNNSSPTEISHLNQPTTNKQIDVSKVSIGVGRDTTSAIDNTNELIISSPLKDEYKYEGDLYADKKHGKGILSWSDGRMYSGAFFADRRHGFGNYEIPNISEFKGLYYRDERFGPGILIYKSLQSADVGLWLCEDLIRLLYTHPKLPLNIHITDKKSRHSSSLVIRSWYSPEELLTTASDFDLLFKKKSPALLCNHIQNGNSFLTQYIIEHGDRIQEIMHGKREQLDAYLSSIYDRNDEQTLKEKVSQERTPDILSPNETYEQQQIYYYANKFWPLKQRASFPIDEIISNSRSSFPNPGPVENASLNLFELSYYGHDRDVRNILTKKIAYVDVCDSHGLTALHFATYNLHINVVNVLLDFGGNVNQLSDDGLTPLSIAFLLYYGNDPKDTRNIALEHIDPVMINPRTSNSIETNHLTHNSNIKDEKQLLSSFNSMNIKNLEHTKSYGYELTNNLSEHIRDEEFRQSVDSLITLLLRRGADPTFSDWPIPVLAFAVRAGDKSMVELLLKKKAHVNCKLNANRHANLTPLHIACGCLSPNAVDIVRLLLEHGADVNAESLPGNNEYFSFLDPLVYDLNKMTKTEQFGRTPLHIACTREPTEDTLNIVRLLLGYKADPNAVCNGQTSLTLAIALGNERLVDLLLNDEKTDPATRLGFGNGNALCTLLSTFYEPHWSYAKRLQLIERIMTKNPKVLYPVRFGPKNISGSSVDYVHYMFSADARISQAPYHSLTKEERVIFSERKELLAYMAKRFREESSKYEEILRLPTPSSGDIHTQAPSPATLVAQHSNSQSSSIKTDKTNDYNNKLTGGFRYCATCGRGVGVRLTPCKRCQKTSFCSKACKVAGWNAFHRYECRLLAETINPLDGTITKTDSFSSRNKFPNIRSKTNQTDRSYFESVGNDFENVTCLDHILFKDSVLSIKTQSRTNTNSRLPPLSVAKLIRQKRLKKLGKLPPPIDESHFSWNYTFDGPENYSFN